MDSLNERLKQKVSKPSSQNRNIHLAAFLGLQKEIKQCLDEGWSRTIIWQALSDEKKISCSYSLFCRLIKLKLTKNENIANQTKQTTKQPIKVSPKPKVPFHYSPIFNEEDLI